MNNDPGSEEEALAKMSQIKAPTQIIWGKHDQVLDITTPKNCPHVDICEDKPIPIQYVVLLYQLGLCSCAGRLNIVVILSLV